MNIFHDTFTTPLGPFSVATDEAGAVVATAFGGIAPLKTRLPECNVLRYITREARAVRAQVLAYFGGELREFALPLAPAGTVFQRRVWELLSKIPFAETRSYGELARALGNPAASRAVGRANATNPICLIVPCHRVIGADGSLTGFAFGEETKRRLLAHEQTQLARVRAA